MLNKLKTWWTTPRTIPPPPPSGPRYTVTVTLLDGQAKQFRFTDDFWWEGHAYGYSLIQANSLVKQFVNDSRPINWNDVTKIPRHQVVSYNVLKQEVV